MKSRKLFTAIAFFAGAVPALAADLPTRKAPPAFLPPANPHILSWNGFYAGVNLGGYFDAGSRTQAATATLPGYDAIFPVSLGGDASGFLGGGQIGYNFQSGHFLGGVEADLQGLAGGASTSHFSQRLVDGFNPNISVGVNGSTSKSLDYLGTVRARVGYLVTPSLLVYGTGGLAYGGANLGLSLSGVGYVGTNNAIFPQGTLLQNAFASTSDSRLLTGWTAGGGLEWMFAPNWSAKAEYLYYDLGSFRASSPVVVVNAPIFGGRSSISGIGVADARFDGHIARVGVNYHF